MEFVQERQIISLAQNTIKCKIITKNKQQIYVRKPPKQTPFEQRQCIGENFAKIEPKAELTAYNIEPSFKIIKNS